MKHNVNIQVHRPSGEHLVTIGCKTGDKEWWEKNGPMAAREDNLSEKEKGCYAQILEAVYGAMAWTESVNRWRLDYPSGKQIDVLSDSSPFASGSVAGGWDVHKEGGYVDYRIVTKDPTPKALRRSCAARSGKMELPHVIRLVGGPSLEG